MLVIEVLKLGESKILLLTQRESQISLLIFCDFWNFCIFMLLAMTLNMLALNTQYSNFAFAIDENNICNCGYVYYRFYARSLHGKTERKKLRPCVRGA